jgi:hypothetical protein
MARPSPGRNRVTPQGDLVAIPLRGAWTGNRGILHSGERIVRFHASDLWITCALRFRDRWHEQWRPHHFTWLYFHDEAVSFAAGHRPCGECRRASYRDYRDRWAAVSESDGAFAVWTETRSLRKLRSDDRAQARQRRAREEGRRRVAEERSEPSTQLRVPVPSAKEMNRRLHGERIVRGTHRRRIHELPWNDLPDGTFVRVDDAPAVVVGPHLTQWTHEGYGTRLRRPANGTAQVITPPSTVAVLRAGYPVQIDESAR